MDSRWIDESSQFEGEVNEIKTHSGNVSGGLRIPEVIAPPASKPALRGSRSNFGLGNGALLRPALLSHRVGWAS